MHLQLRRPLRPLRRPPGDGGSGGSGGSGGERRRRLEHRLDRSGSTADERERTIIAAAVSAAARRRIVPRALRVLEQHLDVLQERARTAASHASHAVSAVRDEVSTTEVHLELLQVAEERLDAQRLLLLPRAAALKPPLQTRVRARAATSGGAGSAAAAASKRPLPLQCVRDPDSLLLRVLLVLLLEQARFGLPRLRPPPRLRLQAPDSHFDPIGGAPLHLRRDRRPRVPQLREEREEQRVVRGGVWAPVHGGAQVLEPPLAALFRGAAGHAPREPGPVDVLRLPHPPRRRTRLDAEAAEQVVLPVGPLALPQPRLERAHPPLEALRVGAERHVGVLSGRPPGRGRLLRGGRRAAVVRYVVDYC